MQLIKDLEEAGLELVIGIETHIRLNTKSKLFCTCPNQEINLPNQHICSICTGQMGTLPAINKEAIRKAIYFGKAVHSTMSNTTISWDRKHYEYPDLPKNFQITQFQNPIIPDGHVKCYRNDGSTFLVSLEQVHIEEDAAKSIHEKNQTLIDFNKSGVPLIEVVTKPCIQNLNDAATYAQYLQRIVQNLNISEANLEKGEFKSDVSISLRKKNTQDLNPRTEIKNLNSFKFMVQALSEEVNRQLAYFKKYKKPYPKQSTVLWDENLKETRIMRNKEFTADYRFLAEPDIPLVNIQNALKTIKVDKSLLPFSVETTLIKGGVRPQDAKFFTSDLVRSKIFLSLNNQINNPLFVAKTLTNNLKLEDYSKIIHIKKFIDLFSLFKNEKITATLLQKSIEQLIENPNFDYKTYLETNTISEEAINQVISDILASNVSIVQEIQAGNINKVGILVGKVIQKLGKNASGKIIRVKILEKLSNKTKNFQDSTSKNQVKSKLNTNTNTSKSVNIAKLEDNPFYSSEIIVKNNYRTHLISQITAKNTYQNITLAGWVISLRDHGELLFIDFRDSSHDVLQIRFDGKRFTNLEQLAKLKAESVIMLKGNIINRTEDDYNPNLRTGTIELDALELQILNPAKTLPFEIKRALKTNETTRFKHKFLDHRNANVRRVLVNRYRVFKTIRDFLDLHNFIEIETPILSAGTDEGAREFIVPSRKHKGSFYTLPQAPQQFKQMLMVGGFEQYFQIARCFRDEDSRGDRQPEFTQLDMEIAFTNKNAIINLNSSLLEHIVNKIYSKKWKLFPFKTLTYHEAMEKYGTDRPDLRFGLEMQDITDIVKETNFQVFSKPIEQGGIVKCIKVDRELQKKRLSKKQIEKLTLLAQSHGLGGLAYILINEDNLQSPIIKFLGEDICKKIIERTSGKVGDIVFFSAADYKTANKALDAVRQHLADMLKIIKPKELHPAWVIDFPLFEKTEEGAWTFSHNPFSMPQQDTLKHHLEGKNIGTILSEQYDLILNGYEIGGGSIRAHKSEILEATYRNMGYTKTEMKKSAGHLYEAFQYGAPPHGGIAWGLDRLIMILEKKTSIREVLAFPKTGSGEDLLFSSPSPLSEKKIQIFKL